MTTNELLDALVTTVESHDRWLYEECDKVGGNGTEAFESLANAVRRLVREYVISKETL